jgi:hypothetical protein
LSWPVITSHFDQGWPDAPHRVLRTSLAAAEESGWQRTTTPSRKSADERVEAMAMYAGTGAGHVAEVRAAGDVVAGLCGDL